MSAQTKFTRGPWQAIGNLVRGPYAMGDSEKPGLLIAECETSDPDRYANAHLISSAPELYEALAELTAVCDANVTVFALERSARAMQAARRALAKARGEA